MESDTASITIRRANEASWRELQEIFGVRGPGYRCQCQRYKLQRGETFARQPPEVRSSRLREQTNAGTPDADTSGLVAYAGSTPVGWCAVEPRSEFCGLLRVFTTPWEGRDEDKADETVWAITCLFVRAGHRKRGVSRALATAAVDYARRSGARALEAYPIDPDGTISEELHVGTRHTFAGAGLTIVTQPSKRRLVMRIEFTNTQGEQR